ncbi:MAG TPA: HlyD family secretion protein [Dehalococcoidia bacterium]|nr:HlyD family secretion protein [Dehalococcoidia bacterium]
MINRIDGFGSTKMLIILSVLALVIVGGSLFGYRSWYNSSHFVSTDNAKVVADLVQVGSLNAGRILRMEVDLGSPVTEGQLIAIVDIPAVISKSDTTNTAKLGFRDVQDQFVEVLAPRSGVVAARWAKAGDTVPAGQPIITLMDAREVWVVANIDEGKIHKVRLGQLVDVRVDTLGRTVSGTVATISPVTAATFSLLPSQNSSSNFNKVSQLVPVKVIFSEANLQLIPGSSVGVKIRIR